MHIEEVFLIVAVEGYLEFANPQVIWETLWLVG
jgi:hypothetical protein